VAKLSVDKRAASLDHSLDYISVADLAAAMNEASLSEYYRDSLMHLVHTALATQANTGQLHLKIDEIIVEGDVHFTETSNLIAFTKIATSSLARLAKNLRGPGRTFVSQFA
jgi:hypothetical protein